MNTKTIFFGTLLLMSSMKTTFAQSEIYGLVRDVYYSTYYDPIIMDSVQQFDSAKIQLGKINLSNNTISPVGNATTFQGGVSITSSALNPYLNTYIYSTGNINSLNTSNGNMVTSAPITNPINASSFDNYIFNQADSVIYGLARRNTYDSTTQTNLGELFFAKINAQSGVITQISTNSIGAGYSFNGRALDPHQMLYYYAVGATLKAVDVYNGNTFNSIALQTPDTAILRCFTYNCNDSSLYGLFNKNFFTYEYDSILGIYNQLLDSTTLRIGKINTTTGVVTYSSSNVLSNIGVAINGGFTIDPTTNNFYFNNGSNIIGVNLTTGLVAQTINLASNNVSYFDLMANTQQCYAAKAVRQKINPTSIQNTLNKSSLKIYPNPTKGIITINLMDSKDDLNVIIKDMNGNVILRKNIANNSELNITNAKSGLYFITVSNKYITLNSKLVIE